LTTCLVEGTDGRLMSKTYDNCVYIDDNAQTMFGKTMSLKDDLMGNWYENFTNIPMEEVKMLLKGNPRDAKVRLAKEIVSQFHGEKEAEKAANEFNTVFREGGVPDEMSEVKAKKGDLLLDILASSKTIESKSDGRRLIKQGGIKVNDKPVTDVKAKVEEGLTPEALAKGVIVKVGKKKFLKINLK
ncbi:MAG: tyrosine--tRNA ligase, partial [Candidatus Peribacteraceae bacterium]|nr:tyrosine--tRNA ligase [Candidatus Peribacteraceae bacterium]